MSLTSVTVQPETKILLDSLSILLQAPPGRVIETLVTAYIRSLPRAEAGIIEGLKQAALARLTPRALSEDGTTASIPTCKFSRLSFKRDVIEGLGLNNSFRVETPIGTFQMTKADFYRVFPKVTRSRCYVEGGLYNYRVLPSQAEQFRVA